MDPPDVHVGVRTADKNPSEPCRGPAAALDSAAEAPHPAVRSGNGESDHFQLPTSPNASWAVSNDPPSLVGDKASRNGELPIHALRTPFDPPAQQQIRVGAAEKPVPARPVDAEKPQSAEPPQVSEDEANAVDTLFSLATQRKHLGDRSRATQDGTASGGSDVSDAPARRAGARKHSKAHHNVSVADAAGTSKNDAAAAKLAHTDDGAQHRISSISSLIRQNKRALDNGAAVDLGRGLPSASQSRADKGKARAPSTADARPPAPSNSSRRRPKAANVDYRRLDAGEDPEERSSGGQRRGREGASARAWSPSDRGRSPDGARGARGPGRPARGAQAGGSEPPRKRAADDPRRGGHGTHAAHQGSRKRLAMDAGDGAAAFGAPDGDGRHLSKRVADELMGRSTLGSKSKAGKRSTGPSGRSSAPMSSQPNFNQLMQASLLAGGHQGQLNAAMNPAFLAGLHQNQLNASLNPEGVSNMLQAALMLMHGQQQAAEHRPDNESVRHMLAQAGLLGLGGFGNGTRECTFCHCDVPLPAFMDCTGMLGDTCLDCRQRQLTCLKAVDMDHQTHRQIMLLATARMALPAAQSAAFLEAQARMGAGGLGNRGGGQSHDAFPNAGSIMAALMQTMAQPKQRDAHSGDTTMHASGDDETDDDGDSQDTHDDHPLTQQPPRKRRTGNSGGGRAASRGKGRGAADARAADVPAADTKVCATCQKELPLRKFAQLRGRVRDSCVACEDGAANGAFHDAALEGNDNLAMLGAAAVAAAAAAGKGGTPGRSRAANSGTAASGDDSDNAGTWDGDHHGDVSSDAGDEDPDRPWRARSETRRAPGDPDARNARRRRSSKRSNERCRQPRPTREGMKVCCLCNLEFPREEFKRKANGYHWSYCATCLPIKFRAERRGLSMDQLRMDFWKKANKGAKRTSSAAGGDSAFGGDSANPMDTDTAGNHSTPGARAPGDAATSKPEPTADAGAAAEASQPASEPPAQLPAQMLDSGTSAPAAPLSSGVAAGNAPPRPEDDAAQAAAGAASARHDADGDEDDAGDQDTTRPSSAATGVPPPADGRRSSAGASGDPRDAGAAAQRTKEQLWATQTFPGAFAAPPPAPAPEGGTKRCLLCEQDRPIEGFKQESYCRECRPLKSRASKRGITVPELRKAMQEGTMASLHLFSPITHRALALGSYGAAQRRAAGDPEGGKRPKQPPPLPAKRTCSSDERVHGLLAALTGSSQHGTGDTVWAGKQGHDAKSVTGGLPEAAGREDDGADAAAAGQGEAEDGAHRLDGTKVANAAAKQQRPMQGGQKGLLSPAPPGKPSALAPSPDELGGPVEDGAGQDVRRSHRPRAANPGFPPFDADALPDGVEAVALGAPICNRSALALQGISTVCGLCQKELPPEAFGTRAKGYRNTYCIGCHRLRARARRRGISVNELRELIIKGKVNEHDGDGGADDGGRNDDSDVSQ